MESLEDYVRRLKDEDIESFNIYKQDPERWRFLTEKIPGLVITSAGGVLPYQAEGTLHGLPFYFRCRHENASIRLVEVGGNAISGEPLYIANMDAPHMINDEKFAEIMVELISKLRRSEFRWEFMGRKVNVDKGLKITQTDEEEISYGWGYTPEEGFRETQVHSTYLLERGFTPEIQDELWRARQLNPTPVNSDNRNWPDPEPKFEVVA